MKKDISLQEFIGRAKAMLYMILVSAAAFLLFAIFTSLQR
jgi:hypothetical protein